MKQPRISLANLSDLDDICAIAQRAFKTDRLSRRQFSYLLHSSQNSLVFAVRSGGKTVGYAVLLMRKNCNWCRIYSLAVERKFQGLGLGKALTKKAIACAKAKGLKGVRLEVGCSNRRARRLYQQMGFKDFCCLPEYYEDGGDAMRMEYKFNS